MDALVENTPRKITRRKFLQIGSIAAGAAVVAAVAPDILAQPSQPKVGDFTQLVINQPDFPTVAPAALKENEQNQEGLQLYDDLTPGIGIGVAWVGSGSSWNTIVENMIKATTSVHITPYVYVPRYQEDSFNAFLAANGMTQDDCHKILCDPEYEFNDDAVEMDSGKHKSVVKSGFPSSWIRDWGTWTAASGSETVQLDIRKDGMVDPLQGTDINLKTIEVGLRFDGGSFFYFKRKDGTPVFLASENELVNNNSYAIKQDITDETDLKTEVTSRIAGIFGKNTEVIYLPRLMDNGVDHIDTFIMPLGEDNIVVGEALVGDKNYDILNGVAQSFTEKGFSVARIPVRRLGDNNTVSFTNVLPHIASEGERYLFMPTYEGFEAEGDMSKEIYSSFGFKVIPVDATSTREKGGAVHCATNTSITAPLIQSI